MRHRAIKDLGQLDYESFLGAISEGLCLVHENATETIQSSTHLARNSRFRGQRILQTIAEEEAAKYLILLDAVRCPFSDSALKARQLAKFNEHLAKGIYAKACSWRPDKFGSLRRYVDDELEEYFLDGPMGVDWIFRNQILAEREELSYVDYVEIDGAHQWLSPQCRSFMDELTNPDQLPSVVEMMDAAHRSHVYRRDALRCFGDLWRDVSLDDEAHYQELQEINVKCWEHIWELTSPTELSQQQASQLTNEFPFPMHPLDMKLRSIERGALKEIRENWTPE